MVKTTKQRGLTLILEKYQEMLQSVSLFRGIAAPDIPAMLACLRAQTHHYSKDEIVLLAGSKPQHIGIVLSGQLHIAKEDIHGGRLLLASLEVSDIFAETLCCANVQSSPVSVLANTASTVLLLQFSRILAQPTQNCDFSAKLTENMLQILAQKNLFLQSRMDIISQKSVRGKVLQYLSGFAPQHGQQIALPLNREQMAQHLCVDRSALSHELALMKKDGLIEYHKNLFRVL